MSTSYLCEREFVGDGGRALQPPAQPGHARLSPTCAFLTPSGFPTPSGMERAGGQAAEGAAPHLKER